MITSNAVMRAIVLRDDMLSWGAKGLFCWLQDKPNVWRDDFLTDEEQDYLHELRQNGYVEFEYTGLPKDYANTRIDLCKSPTPEQFELLNE